MPTSEAVKERDDTAFALLDLDPHLSAKDIADQLEISRSLAHQALRRLEASGMIKRDDLKGYPITWSVVGAPDDDLGSATITGRDALFVVHMLRAMVSEGRAGEPTEQLIERIERACE